MLELQSIDATIRELTLNAEAADNAAAQEEHNIEDATKRRSAAQDKANSCRATISALGLAREEMEKVRPMLGFLNGRPQEEIVMGTQKRRRTHAYDAVLDILTRAGRAMGPQEILQQLHTVPGLQTYTGAGLSILLSKETKRNGSARFRRVSVGQYAVVEKPMAVGA